MWFRPVRFACVVVLWSAATSYSQQTGPRTLENPLNSDEAQKLAAAAEVAAAPVADATDEAPKRPEGTVARPKDGVQHPDLDKAWAAYDAAVTKVAEEIRAAINKQFDAATAKGDLDAAEKWQVIGEKFEKAGELPAETETKAAVSSAADEFKKARDQLTEAYEAVVKSLTIQKRIAEAKLVRTEANTVLVHRSESDATSVKPSKEGSRAEAGGRDSVTDAAIKPPKVEAEQRFRFDGVWVCETNGWVGTRTVRGDSVNCAEGPVGRWQKTGEQITVTWAEGGFIKLTLDPKNPDVLRGRNHRNTPTVWVRQKK